MSDTPGTTQPKNSPFGWERFRVAVAALLLAASVVKILNMAQILTGGGLLGTMPRLTAVTAFEAALAVYLLVGNPLLSWLLTLATFAIFLAFSVYAMGTDQSCHCFGEQFAPEAMVMVDTIVLLLTGFLRPDRWHMPSRTLIRQLTLVAVVGGLVMISVAWRYEVLLSQERSRLLVADVLVGKAWPLTGQIDPRLSELSIGKWMILITREDCVHCRNMVARFFADPETHRPGERTAVFVFSDDDDGWQFQFDRVTLDPTGDDFLNWPHGKPYVINPAVFLVDNGIVVAAAEGTGSDQFLDTILSDFR